MMRNRILFVFLLLNSICVLASTQSSDVLNAQPTDASVINSSNWQKVLTDAIAASVKIQNLVERNKLSQLLNKLQKTTQDIQVVPSADNPFLMQHYQAQWEEIDAKLKKRLLSAKQNLPDNQDKILILSILTHLSQEADKMLPANTKTATTVSSSTTTLSIAEQGCNLYYEDLLKAKLPEVKQVLQGFSPSTFISYAWGPTEQAFVPQFAHYLELAGIQVRLDVKHNRLSTEIHTGFVTELEQVDYVLVVGSKLYADKAKQGKNNVVSTEARIIAERNKRQPGRVLPLLLSGDPKEAFPAFLRDKVFVNFADSKHYVQNVGAVILAMSKYAQNYEQLQSLIQSINNEAVKIQNLPQEKLEERYYLQQKLQHQA